MNYDIGQRIRKYRQQNSVKQEELANHLYINQSTLSKIENGLICVNIEQLINVSNYLKINLSQLIPEVYILSNQIDVSHQIMELLQDIKFHKDTNHQLIKRIASLEDQLKAHNLHIVSINSENNI